MTADASAQREREQATRKNGFPSLLGSPPLAEPEAVYEEVSNELLSSGFVRHVLGMGLATIVFTAVFFLTAGWPACNLRDGDVCAGALEQNEGVKAIRPYHQGNHTNRGPSAI